MECARTSAGQDAFDQTPQQLATPLESSPDAPFLTPTTPTPTPTPTHTPAATITAQSQAQGPGAPGIASGSRIAIPRLQSVAKLPAPIRITRACVQCQRKKTRCDGRKPRCGFCMRSGAACTYSKSKRENQELQVRSLGQRIRAYESVLQEIVERSATSSPGNAGDSRRVIQDAIQNHFDASPEFFSTLLSAGSLFEQEIPVPRPGLSLGRMHLAWQSNERSKAMILLQQPPVKVTSIEYWTKLVDNDVASHLLSLYFTWENPTWQLIDQALFVHDLEHRRGRFCSSLLVHTLLFFGCSFSYNLDRITDRREEKVLGEKLYSVIQRLWLQERNSVDLPTAQSSILIGLLCCTFGLDKIGTNYIMNGGKISTGLGIHEKNCPYFFWDIDDDPTALSNCQRLVAWGVFDVQALACLVYRKKQAWDKPPAMSFSQEEAAILDEGVEWSPYPFQTPVSQPFFYTASWVRSGLVAIVHEIARFALKYPGPALSDQDWEYGNTLYQKLLDWNAKLPWSVLLRHNTTPHVICLHLYYQTTIVSLCEIFILNADIESQSQSKSKSPFNPTSIKSLAHDTLATLLLLFKNHHGYKSIPVVFLHYFCVGGMHAVSKLHPSHPKWGLVLECAVVGLWHMSLGWGRLCKAFLRMIDLVLKAKNPDPGLVSDKVKAICGMMDGELWSGVDTENLAADYVVYHVPGDLGERKGVGAEAGVEKGRGVRARALQELLVAMEGLDVGEKDAKE